ncbi:hypothetical protein J2Z69_002426 [Paenibacillus shirakamiensis]|uniref:Uncharacterized protein n=1 Tax=Paenibacillus shirakamiensis TaxID=1265935 RepID=A0ABS4JI27_9BACL|nr:hypothetical protein [Paenibacillus shirakamiensis]MBP2001383.1 hypothetical protein [Paenibacillus shirakamiensis]
MNSDKNSEQYNYSNVTEEDGLPTIYRTEIETHNWREVDRLGAKYVFEKYEQKVSLFIFTGKIELRKIQEYK